MVISAIPFVIMYAKKKRERTLTGSMLVGSRFRNIVQS